MLMINATSRYRDGQIKGVIGIAQDITEFLASHEDWKTIISTAHAPIFGVDSENKGKKNKTHS